MAEIGILALQGNYAMHARSLAELGVESRLVRQPQDIAGLEGLILPGGESSALLKLMTPFNWQQALRDFVIKGHALFGTCAGAILLASTVEPDQESLGLIDIKVVRNAYGRQLESFVDNGPSHDKKLGEQNLVMVFIRAPKIEYCGERVKVLATHNDDPVLVSQKRVMVATFHPEMHEDTRVHRYFCEFL